ncbi:MAG: porin [Candidatus Methylopumilus sp.]|jgi:predicted porin
MNKKLSMAVAGAVMAFGASAANAGITIPAGDWTIDIGGNVNAYYTHTSFSGDQESNVKGAFTDKSANTVQTGLLPSALGIGGKTRQNDLDIAFQFTFFTGSDSGTGQAFGNNSLNIRQSYLTFGDKSWGTIKGGRDLGIFASDAILSDMTLLGVGAGAGQGGSSTLGRIGSGYQYADWKGQISYASPNWNGFDFAVGITEGYKNAVDSTNANLGYEGKVGYTWAGDVSGKVWAGFVSQKHEGTVLVDSYTTRGVDVGAKVAVAGFGLVGYYYDGRGLSGAATAASANSNLNLNGGVNFLGTAKTDDKGGYIQGTYTIPGVGTKLGLSYGESKSDAKVGTNDFKNKSWIVGAYHPLTKSLNLVAEYTDNKIDGTNANGSGTDNIDLKAKTVSLGAIMFF